MKGSRGKATGALCVCRLPNAGPRACPLGNSPSLSGPVPSRTPHNFLLLGCPAQWAINPSCLPWFSFTQGKVTHPCFAGGGGAGPSSEAPFRQQQQTPRCPHPHTPASASVPLRTSFGAQRTLPTCRGGERARQGMPSGEQLPAVIDGTRSLANPKSFGWDHSKAGILDWFPVFPSGIKHQLPFLLLVLFLVTWDHCPIGVYRDYLPNELLVFESPPRALLLVECNRHPPKETAAQYTDSWSPHRLAAGRDSMP